MTRFVLTNLAHFSNGKALSFMQLVLAEGGAFEDERVKSTLVLIKEKCDALIAASNISRTTEMTDRLRNLSSLVDSKLSTLRLFASLMSKSSDSDLSKAAAQIAKLFALHGNVNKGGYETKAGRVSILLEGAKSIDQEILAKVGFATLVTDIEQANTQFNDLYVERNAYRKANKQAVAKAREGLELAFKPLWNLVSAYAHYDSAYQTFIDRIDEFALWNTLSNNKKADGQSVSSGDEADAENAEGAVNQEAEGGEDMIA